MRCLFFLILIHFGWVMLPPAARAQTDGFHLYTAIEGGFQMVTYEKVRYSFPDLISETETAFFRIRPDGVFDYDGPFDMPAPIKDSAAIATGGIGAEWTSPLFEFLIFSSRLHLGGELNFGYSAFRSAPDNVYSIDGELVTGLIIANDIVITDTVQLTESFALNAITDLGLYVSPNLLLFGRVGYAYIESEQKIASVAQQRRTLLNARDEEIRTLQFFTRYAEAEEELHTLIAGGGLRYQLSTHLGLRFYYLNHIGRREAHDLRFGFVWRVF